jgi:hypothetical protein
MKKNQKGQALIELIIFLPLMFTFYSMISGFANAINGSINQQKIARAYFYYRAQNNSTIPKPDEGETFKNWGTFGMFFIGWKDYFDNQKPMAPCYQLTIPLKAGASDKCEEKYSEPTSLYIRVQTAYGICGETYLTNKSVNTALPILDWGSPNISSVITKSSCFITQ